MYLKIDILQADIIKTIPNDTYFNNKYELKISF